MTIYTKPREPTHFVDFDDPDLLRRLQARWEAEDPNISYSRAVIAEDEPEPPVLGDDAMPIPDNITPDTPLPLELAARVAFPTGTMTVSGLRNEIRKKNLQASKVAGRVWTTLRNIERMMERCRITEAEDAPEGRNCISENRSDREAPSGGSSSTAPPAASASRSAQAHLNQIAQRLRKPSADTSPPSTSPTSAKVVPIKS